VRHKLQAVETLEPLEEEDSYAKQVARELGLTLDGIGEDDLISRSEAAVADWTEQMLLGAIRAEARLSSQSRNKRAIKRDIQAAYDELDKSLDVAETVMECLKINVQTGAYKEASTKLGLLEAEHQKLLFGDD